jgi:hypothetical protein
MRATFITTALENGAQLEDVQKAAGHPTRAQRSFTTVVATTPRRQQASLPRIEVRTMPWMRMSMTQAATKRQSVKI